ncbi:LysR family transcriptional regulator [Mesorhizobium sp. CA18]|uniref:LysR family transcriptional regulator n=1 Tax=unclassified Mesorhizobium TaxID=325217 RepID=UPI001CCFA764|nr:MULTISPECIES: LysR family transcriptional regulator [unclassified Mesorhizobium]MBZ9736011.1 LysR family transcriptional regulator [Mesorhizobium sp. CA9]MBZ9826683.1 LysR family transcriptional regulator [Mesorhizobium sp. CA18]MBZ9830911.1 LysR family transcriptional regulator [Mesorhizobium sp. CA2]MBZ9835414.1 LysR family transcriptional regulator [Mesorhizobium sp. CA3]MBZ9875902.1 LysR family transcriptional regulator [Mesorhizobium sp. Ca11]
MDRLESMEVFVKAADLGSFAAAAAALDLSGPMVGKHVRFLEERLGMRLINRTTRRQSLTDFGRAYYERCRIVLAEAQAAEALAADQLSEPRGTLRVTMPAHFGRHCVTPILIELARRYPTLELDLSLSDRFVDLVEDGFDLAIRTGTLDDRAGIIARRVARQRMIVCASPSYIESFGRPLQPEDIASHQAIVYRRLGHVLQPWLFTRDDDSVTQIAPAGRLRLDDLDAIADAATDGMGLAWLPYWLVRQRIEGGTLVRLLPEQRDYLYDCHALRLQAPHLPLKVRLAVDALAVGLPKMMS